MESREEKVGQTIPPAHRRPSACATWLRSRPNAAQSAACESAARTASATQTNRVQLVVLSLLIRCQDRVKSRLCIGLIFHLLCGEIANLSRLRADAGQIIGFYRSLQRGLRGLPARAKGR